MELVASDVLDHYRTYSLLERLLFAPTKLSEQPSFQLEPLSQQLLIEKYYNLDDTVAREILGKKLSSRYRKDLDEVADRTGIRLKSCHRQFDNVKRIFKCVEELPGSVTNNIKQNFMLPDELARYAPVSSIHISHHHSLMRIFWFTVFTENMQQLCSLPVFASRHPNDVYNIWISAISSNALNRSWHIGRTRTSIRDQSIMIRKWIVSFCSIYVKYGVCSTKRRRSNSKYWNSIVFTFLDHFSRALCISFYSLVLIRLKPTLLDRTYYELDLNFR